MTQEAETAHEVVIKMVELSSRTIRKIKEAIETCGTADHLIIEEGEERTTISAEDLNGMRHWQSHRLDLLLEVLQKIPIPADNLAGVCTKLAAVAAFTKSFSEVGSEKILKTVQKIQYTRPEQT